MRRIPLFLLWLILLGGCLPQNVLPTSPALPSDVADYTHRAGLQETVVKTYPDFTIVMGKHDDGELVCSLLRRQIQRKDVTVLELQDTRSLPQLSPKYNNVTVLHGIAIDLEVYCISINDPALASKAKQVEVVSFDGFMQSEAVTTPFTIIVRRASRVSTGYQHVTLYDEQGKTLVTIPH